jgi:hypothetical protein
MDSVKKYSRDEARKKAQWISDCRKLQRRVAKLNRALDSAQVQLKAATAAKHLAVVSKQMQTTDCLEIAVEPMCLTLVML